MLDYLRIMLDAQKAKMDERGASAVEYGLLIAGIAALIVAVVFLFGGALKDVFHDTCNSVSRYRAPADRSQPDIGGRGPSWSAATRCHDLPPDRDGARHARLPAHRPVSGPRTSRHDDERGASAVEYGLLIAGIAALISLVVYAFGGGVGLPLHRHLQLDPGAARPRHLLTPPRHPFGERHPLQRRRVAAEPEL